MFSLSDYDYELDERLIAQKPVDKRNHSRLLVLHNQTGKIFHSRFEKLCDFFSPADVLAINNTKVVPGRLFGEKKTGGKVEILLLDYARVCKNNPNNGELIFKCLVKASKGSKPGSLFFFDNKLKAEV